MISLKIANGGKLSQPQADLRSGKMASGLRGPFTQVKTMWNFKYLTQIKRWNEP